MRAIIIDDEQLTRELIKEILTSEFLGIEIVGEADNYQSAIDLIETTSPELMLLDINLGNRTIFEVLEQVPNIDARLIFITAYSDYAVKAIKFSAFDYILKPIIPSELIKAVNKAVQLNKEEQDEQLSLLSKNISNPEKIVLKTSDKMYIVNLKDIVYCEADNNYTIFHLKDGKDLILSKSLKIYEELLSDNSFFRVHQSYLVNLNAIVTFEKHDGGYLVMSNKQSVPVSTTKKKKLLNHLQKIYMS